MSAKRIKDASFIQQHIEKLILLAGILVFAVAVFLFVIGNPFAIEVNRQTYDDPADAIDVLVNIDTQLENGLNEPKPIPPLIVPNFRDNFEKMMEREADLDQLVNGMGDPGITFGGLDPVRPTQFRYALAYPPVPNNVMHVDGTDVLDKEFDEEVTKAFFELWGKDLEEPGDFTMFVAAGEFDIWEWVTRLKEPSIGEGEIKIPAGIWAQRFGIAGVALLREEWDPVEGRWTNRKIVEPMPGQTRVLPDFKADTETNLALAQLAALREAQLELAQPEMPWLMDFVQVTPPGPEGEGVGADGLIQGLADGNLGPAELEILKLEEKIQQLEERRAARNNRGGGDAGPGGPADFDAPSPERRDPMARQIESLREKIEKLRPKARKEEENRRRLEEARRLREAERARRDALRSERDRALNPGEANEGLARIEGMDLQEGSTLRVWAADPSMQPGKTYHYKLLVAAINPLYAVPRLAPDQLEENQQRAAILPSEAEIDAMPWIGPIKVEPETRFFFTNAGESRATIEIYRRHKGKVVVQEFTGAPGDSIGTVMEVEDELGQIDMVDMSIGAILVDVEKSRDVFSGSGSTVYTLIFTDDQGNIFERTTTIDKNSPERKELRDEIENGPDWDLRPAPEARPGDNFDPGNFEVF